MNTVSTAATRPVLAMIRLQASKISPRPFRHRAATQVHRLGVDQPLALDDADTGNARARDPGREFASVVGFGGNIRVRPDILGVVEIFQHIEELQHFLAGVDVQFDQGLGPLVISACSGSPDPPLQASRTLSKSSGAVSTSILPSSSADDVLGACLEAGFHDLILIGARARN
jgi:hypothetical protein